MKKGLNYKELFLRQKSGSLIECFPSFQDTPGSIPSLSQEGGGPNRTSFVQYGTLELERWLLEAPAALPDDLIPFPAMAWDSLFWPLLALHTHGVQMYTGQTYI